MAYLGGVALLHLAYGSLDVPTVAAAMQAEPAAWVAIAVMTSGLLLKTALFPLHFWLPPARERPGTGQRSPLGVGRQSRFLPDPAPLVRPVRRAADTVDGHAARSARFGRGDRGALGGRTRASRLKLLAAYSTVAQLGYLFVGLAMLTSITDSVLRDALLGGLVLLALTHGFAKAGLFLAIGIVQQRSGHDRIADLDGTAQRLPATTFAIALAEALIGLPPAAFLGKWELMSAALALGQWVLVMAIGSLMAAGYFVRILDTFPVLAPTRPPRSGSPRGMAGAAARLHRNRGARLGSAWLWPLLGGGQ